jgi:alkanesulfonate monooxygenase SsuD/methylene tetrahydromethanopterin reductase-like flavin-dependent oxidoreductase (luciferase family)
MFGMRFDLRNPPMAGVSMDKRYSALLDMAEWAEQRGGVAVILCEHHGSDDGYLPNPLLMAAGVAARTRAIRIGIASLVGPFHDPLRLAEDLAVLDNLAQGRIDVIISGGYALHEFEMFGIPPAERGKRMVRLFDTLKTAWTGEPFAFDGRVVRVTPAPYRAGGPPLTMGGSSEAAARRAARIADAFLPSEPRFWDFYVDECAKLGKADPGPNMSSGASTVYVADDVERAWSELGPYFLHESTSYASWGQTAGVANPYRLAADVDELRASGLYRILTPQACVEELTGMGDLAFTLLHPMVGGIPPARAWEMLELFERSVLPAVSG